MIEFGQFLQSFFGGGPSVGHLASADGQNIFTSGEAAIGDEFAMALDAQLFGTTDESSLVDGRVSKTELSPTEQLFQLLQDQQPDPGISWEQLTETEQTEWHDLMAEVAEDVSVHPERYAVLSNVGNTTPSFGVSAEHSAENRPVVQRLHAIATRAQQWQQALSDPAKPVFSPEGESNEAALITVEEQIVTDDHDRSEIRVLPSAHKDINVTGKPAEKQNQTDYMTPIVAEGRESNHSADPSFGDQAFSGSAIASSIPVYAPQNSEGSADNDAFFPDPYLEPVRSERNPSPPTLWASSESLLNAPNMPPSQQKVDLVSSNLVSQSRPYPDQGIEPEVLSPSLTPKTSPKSQYIDRPLSQISFQTSEPSLTESHPVSESSPVVNSSDPIEPLLLESHLEQEAHAGVSALSTVSPIKAQQAILQAHPTESKEPHLNTLSVQSHFRADLATLESRRSSIASSAHEDKWALPPALVDPPKAGASSSAFDRDVAGMEFTAKPSQAQTETVAEHLQSTSLDVRRESTHRSETSPLSSEGVLGSKLSSVASQGLIQAVTQASSQGIQQSTALSADPVIDKAVAHQAVQGTLTTLESGRTEMTLKLAPEHLGEMEIQLVSQGDQSVQAVFKVATPEALSVLKSQMDAMKQTLESQAVRMDNIQVVLAGSAETAMNQQSQHQGFGSGDSLFDANAGQQHQAGDTSQGFGQAFQHSMNQQTGHHAMGQTPQRFGHNNNMPTLSNTDQTQDLTGHQYAESPTNNGVYTTDATGMKRVSVLV